MLLRLLLLLNADDSNAFCEPAVAEVPTALLSARQQFLRAVGYSYAAVRYTTYLGEFQTLTAECIGAVLTVCIATCL